MMACALRSSPIQSLSIEGGNLLPPAMKPPKGFLAGGTGCHNNPPLIGLIILLLSDKSSSSRLSVVVGRG
jgi:hypothetical protein